MSKPSIQSNSNASLQSSALEIEQTRLLYGHLPLSIVINLLLASILVYIQRSVIELAILVGWLISIFLVMFYRAALLTFWHHSKANNMLSWKRYFRVGVFATGSVCDEVIVRTIIVMSNTLGMKVIAEGVETEDQRDILARNGCYTYQGYLFGKPLPIEDFLKH